MRQTPNSLPSLNQPLTGRPLHGIVGQSRTMHNCARHFSVKRLPCLVSVVYQESLISTTRPSRGDHGMIEFADSIVQTSRNIVRLKVGQLIENLLGCQTCRQQTRIRIPRIQGLPPHCSGLTVIRLNSCVVMRPSPVAKRKRGQYRMALS